MNPSLEAMSITLILSPTSTRVGTDKQIYSMDTLNKFVCQAKWPLYFVGYHHTRPS